MDNRPQSAIKPSVRNEILSEASLSSKPRQMSDGNVKITILPNNQSSMTTTTSNSYTEHRSSSISSSTSTGGGMLLLSETSAGIPETKSPSSLKRSSSWKKFKNTVKETVSGIVNLSVGQSPSSEGLVEDINPVKTSFHPCENLSPDVHQKLVHSSTEDIFLPPMEDGPSAFERLERQADAAFAAAANFPTQSTPLMVTLPPTIQSHAPQLPNVPNKGPPHSITAVPQIVVTSDTPEVRRELKIAAMSSPRKILKNADKAGGESVNIPPTLSSTMPTGLSILPPNSTDKSSPLRFSNSMTNIPNLSQKRVSWGDIPPDAIPVSSEPTNGENKPQMNESTATTEEERKRVARLKIKNALLGAAVSAGNDNLINLMQSHLSSTTPVPLQTSSSTSNFARTEIKSGMPIPKSGENQGQIRRSSECGSPGNDILGQSPKSGSPGSKIGRSSSMRKAKPKPMIWEHFDVVPNNSSQGRCKTCHMTISCKHNTGQFVRHLQLAHMDIFRKYENKIQTEWTRSIVQKTAAK